MIQVELDDLIRYFKAIKRRNKDKASEKLLDYYFLTNIHHTSKPDELSTHFREQIDSMNKSEDKDTRVYEEESDLTQIDRLRRFREERGLQ